MAAYAALTLHISRISLVLEKYGVIFSTYLPLTLEAYKFAHKELKSFRDFVERLDSRSRERMNASLEHIVEAIRNYNMEKLELLNDAGYADFMGTTHSIVEQFQKVKEEYNTLLPEVEQGSSIVVSKSKMVGVRDMWRLLKDYLLDPWREEHFYLLVGMAGIGKTALAREIFEDLDIIEWFDCHAWVTIGIERKSDEIMEVILAQVAPEAHKMIMGGSKEEIGEVLIESLKGKRYLIVLDDVWNADAQRCLESLLPNNKDGSHVLLTSRMQHFGSGVGFPNWINMRLLNEEESWDLLQEKVFAGGSCPPHLEEAGKKIAEKCDGLPLTILIIADSLSNAKESLWIDMAIKKKHQIFIDAYDQISKVLYPSYNKIDDGFKTSFLFMGAFLLKYEIPKSKLINLWIVEDFFIQLPNSQTFEDFFIQPNSQTFDASMLSNSETLEYSAANMLEYYEYNSLIMACRDITSAYANFSGHIKSCRLHSSWWHFCQLEARKKNLFLVLDCYDKDGIEEVLAGHSRLSIHSNVLFALKHVYNSIEKICAFTVQTLLCFGPYCQYMVPVCFGLKFLCRLDALNIRFYDFPLEVLKLVKLRYLALTCNRRLPSSISNLQKLQYLIVHPHLSIKLHRATSYMPVEIWDLEELKHLEVKGYDLPHFGEKTLQKLATLSDGTTSSCTILNRVPNLKKLRFTIELAPDVADPLCCFDQISILTKLEKLTCVIVNPECKFKVVSPVSSFPSLPNSLTKLSLSGLGYHWEEMSKIALLPNLKVLKLQCNAFQGTKWKVEEGGFPHLLALLIEDIDLENLKWAHGSFKSLEVLRINHCFKLKELQFGDIPKIIKIEVVDCSPLVELHVKRNMLRIRRHPDISVHSSWRP